MGIHRPTSLTSKHLKELLPSFLRSIDRFRGERPDLVMSAWSDVVGERMAPMTAAVSFREGILTVKVRNSSLLQVLAQHERKNLLKRLREKFPAVKIHNIRFMIG